MTLCYDDRGRPTGLNWTVINASCPQDPAVWKTVQVAKPPKGTHLPDEIERGILRRHSEGATAVEIAEEWGISSITVGKVLNRNGVTQDRGRGTRQRTSEVVAAEVIRLYTEEEMGGSGIRNRLGLSHATIYKILRRNGIPTRRAA
jgi:DNA invertase Pin-like site-specific DNA recombinase